MISKFKFRRAMGDWPKYDDMDRCNCEHAGKVGHIYCGWCSFHDLPRKQCGCSIRVSSIDVPHPYHDFKGAKA